MAKLIRKAKRTAKSITGFSTPFFGIQWDPPRDDREIVRQLLVYLEDRRALYNPCSWEEPRAVYESVQEIRDRLTQTKSRLTEGAIAVGHVSAMRLSCRTYLNSVEPMEGYRRRDMHWDDRDFLQALGALRAAMGIHIAALCETYGVEVESELQGIFPAKEEI